MRNLYIYLSALYVLSPQIAKAMRPGGSPIRDLASFPKYEVQFLNELPLAASDAARCRKYGIEKLEEWMGSRPLFGEGEGRRLTDGMNSEGGGGEFEEIEKADRLELVPMHFGYPSQDAQESLSSEYLCLMPGKNETDAQMRQAQSLEAEEDGDDDIDPASGWSALSHLDGKCLYSKQGWFTYSYCHNSHIRQFKEARHAHPHPPGGYTPEEDTTYDAYTLGKARPAQPKKQIHRKPGDKASLPAGTGTTPETSVDRANPHDHRGTVSFGLGASSRYLVQKWSDGTRCDKTGKPREIEVQVHCSMTTNDMIYMIKELSICSYVMIIHSPHLCSIPGFKIDQLEINPLGISCRQVLDDEDYKSWEEGDMSYHPKSPVPTGQSTIPAGRQWPRLDGTGRGMDVQVIGASELGLGEFKGSLKDMLTDALEKLAKKRASEQDSQGSDVEDAGAVVEEEMMVLSLGEDGELMMETEIHGADDIQQEEREQILHAVREFLQSKGKKTRGKSQSASQAQEEQDAEDLPSHDEL